MHKDVYFMDSHLLTSPRSTLHSSYYPLTSHFLALQEELLILLLCTSEKEISLKWGKRNLKNGRLDKHFSLATEFNHFLSSFACLFSSTKDDTEKERQREMQSGMAFKMHSI